MDTVTHGIAGALVAKAFFSERGGRAATAAVTLGAVFPDSDTFAGWLNHNQFAVMEIHRGVTHSLLALPVFALLLGGLTALLARRRKWMFLSLCYGVGLGSHILLDLITSFGTMIWSPLSNVRVSWDTVFIIDLILTAIVLLPQLTAWVYADRSGALTRGLGIWAFLAAAGMLAALLAAWAGVPLSPWAVTGACLLMGALLWLPSWKDRGFLWRRAQFCRAGVAALAVYLGLSFLAHQAALGRVEEIAGRYGLTVERMAALPNPPSLLRWAGLIQTREGVYRASIGLLDDAEPSYEFFLNAEDNPYVQTAERLADVQTYLWFARFPWVRYREDNGLHIVEYSDIQFFGNRRGTDRFTFRVAFDGEGRVVSSRFPAR